MSLESQSDYLQSDKVRKDTERFEACREKWCLESYPAAPRSETSEEPPIRKRQAPHNVRAVGISGS